jgi:TolB-like protein
VARPPPGLAGGKEIQSDPAIDRISKLPTVTVTPFDSLSEDPAQVYLARGITADLTTDLSRLGACA